MERQTNLLKLPEDGFAGSSDGDGAAGGDPLCHRDLGVPLEETVMIESSVQFRYVAIQADQVQVPGLCLSYLSKKEAEKAFSLFHEYIISRSGSKSLSVRFKTIGSGECTLTICVITPERVFDVLIEHVETSLVKKIEDDLKSVSYYVILAGYEDKDEFRLLPPKDFHLFKKDVVIDGKCVLGKNEVKVDWLRLFGE